MKMTKFVKYKNHNIVVHIEGSGEVLVFLHGWPVNSNLWKSQVDFFKDNYKVITFDWLGFGQSDKPVNHHYTFTNKKDILDEVLSSVLKKEEKVTIIAHDVGGPPAILWTSENQGRVNRLIVLNTIVYPFSTALDQLSHVLFKTPVIKNIIMSSFGLKILMNVIMTKGGGVAHRNRINEILAVHQDLTTEIKLKTILEPLEQGKKNEFLILAKKYKELKVEKHLIVAKKDSLCYAHVKKLSEENPAVPTHIIENCGHFIPIDKPDFLNEILNKIILLSK